MKGQLMCQNEYCKYGIHVEGTDEEEDVLCPQCGTINKDVRQDDLGCE